MKIKLRKFTVEMTDGGYECRTAVIKKVKGMMPTNPTLGSSISADQIFNMVSNGNIIKIVPNEKAMKGRNNV